MELYNNLRELTDLIKDEVENKFAAGELQFSLIDYKCIETTIDEDGGFHFDHRDLSVIYWGKSYPIILNSLEKKVRYTEINDFLHNCYYKMFNQPNNSENPYLFPIPDEIIKRFIFAYLNNPFLSDDEIEDLIKTLIKDSEGKPLKYTIKAELKGINLDIDEIKVNDHILLRKPKKEDLKICFPTDIRMNSFQKTEPVTPNTILEINFESIMDISTLKLVDAIRILRLYKVGNVKCTESETFSKSFNFQESDLTSKIICESDEPIGHEIWYTLNNSAVQKIRDFWDLMIDIIPTIQSKGYLSIAFNRYNSALKITSQFMLFNSDSIERKITEAVMGLEILYLKDEEENQVARKFKRRIGRIMDIIGDKNLPHEDLAEIAYNIRSEFLHWGAIKEETENKLKGHFDLEEFLKVILNYLRVSILVMMLIDKDRDEIINLIIDSFNKRTSEKELTNMLSNVKIYF